MTREELEADYQRMKKQSQQDYKDLFGSEAPSLRRDASHIIKAVEFMGVLFVSVSAAILSGVVVYFLIDLICKFL